MKQSVLAVATFFFLTVGLHAQKQLPVKIDTAMGKLGFYKQNHWTLPLKNPIKLPEFNLQNPARENTNKIIARNQMPIHRSEINDPMPIFTPDPSSSYKLRIFGTDQ